MLHNVLEHLLLIERWEWHVPVIHIVDVVVEFRNKECNVLRIWGGERVGVVSVEYSYTTTTHSVTTHTHRHLINILWFDDPIPF